MSRRLKKLAVIAASMVIAATSNEGVLSSVKADAAYGVGGNGKAVMEYLDRGIYAVKNGNGMFVSWRYNANDADNAEFRLYRDDKVIYTANPAMPPLFRTMAVPLIQSTALTASQAER